MDENIRFDDELSSSLEQTNPTAAAIADRHRRCRRNLIITGGLAVPAALSLPSQWQRPFVDSVLLPAHAQTTCAATVGSTKLARTDDPCVSISLTAALEGAQASLLTPSGTVIPVLSLTGLQIGGCCNAFGATVTATAASANLVAPAAPVALPLETGVVSITGNFGLSFIPPVSPLIPISDIVDISVELDCDGEAQASLLIPGAMINSVVGGLTPIPVVCSI